MRWPPAAPVRLKSHVLEQEFFRDGDVLLNGSMFDSKTCSDFRIAVPCALRDEYLASPPAHLRQDFHDSSHFLL